MVEHYLTINYVGYYEVCNAEKNVLNDALQLGYEWRPMITETGEK